MKLSPTQLAEMADKYDRLATITELAAQYEVSIPYVSYLARHNFKPPQRPRRPNKLTPTMVAAIRRDHYQHPEWTQQDLADRYGVTQKTISGVLSSVNPWLIAETVHCAVQHPDWTAQQIADHVHLPIGDTVKILRKKAKQIRECRETIEGGK